MAIDSSGAVQCFEHLWCFFPRTIQIEMIETSQKIFRTLCRRMRSDSTVVRYNVGCSASDCGGLSATVGCVEFQSL